MLKLPFAYVTSFVALSALLTTACSSSSDGGGVGAPDTSPGDDASTTFRPDGDVTDTGSSIDTSTNTDSGGTDVTTADATNDSANETTGDDAPSDTSSDAPVANQVLVGASGSAYTPPTLTIKVGDTVTWKWVGNFHSVTLMDGVGSCTVATGGFDSGVHSAGFTFTHTFNSAGTFPYGCTVHCGFGMKGKIVVQ